MIGVNVHVNVDPASSCLPGPAHHSVWADWTYWTSSWPSPCSQESLHFIQSAAQKKKTSQQNVWTRDEGLAWHPDSVVDPLHQLHFLSPSLTLHPLLPPPHPPPHNWLWKMASVSHLGTKIKGKLQPTSMQNVIWKPPSYVLTIDFSLSSSSPSLSLCPFLLISLLHFYRGTILRSVKFEEKRPPEPYSRWNRKERSRGRGDSPWLCLFAFRVHFVM